MSSRRKNPLWVLAALSLVACEEDAPSRKPDGPSPPSDACQASPGELPRPPAGSLPCELMPPGFELAGTK